jgi:hypothetical protein
MTTIDRPRRALLVGLVAVVIALAACSGGPAASTSPTPTPSPSAAPSADPGASDGGSGSAGDPDTGVGMTPPVDPTPVDPAAGQPALVRPLPGRRDPHPVAPTAIQASVDGRHVLVKITWYGGVEPCGVLDSVKVERTGTDITLTPIEGSSDPNAMCVEMAMLKATIVDLGELEPGTYRISSPGSDAAPVEITVE